MAETKIMRWKNTATGAQWQLCPSPLANANIHNQIEMKTADKYTMKRNTSYKWKLKYN